MEKEQGRGREKEAEWEDSGGGGGGGGWGAGGGDLTEWKLIRAERRGTAVEGEGRAPQENIDIRVGVAGGRSGGRHPPTPTPTRHLSESSVKCDRG